MTLILGGARSGKTSWALKRCETYPAPRLYLATAQAWDEEMFDRIRRHQAERGPDWTTIEEPFDPTAILTEMPAGQASIVLLDCLTLFLSNLITGLSLPLEEVLTRIEGLGRAIETCTMPVIIVSNEVGLGIVPDNKLAREFRDAAGWAHQKLARSAAEVYFITAGLAQRLK